MTIEIIIAIIASIAVIILVIFWLVRKNRTIAIFQPQLNGECRIYYRCRKSDAKPKIEDLIFRCTADGKDNGRPCANHITPISFDEMVSGYRTNKENKTEIKLLREPLNIASFLSPKYETYVFKRLKSAKCAIDGKPIAPYCKLEQHEGEHRINFDLDLSDVISLTGAVDCGKTVYFHLLEEYLRGKYVNDYKIPVNLSPDASRERIRLKLTEMHETKKLMEPTAVGEEMEIQLKIGPSDNGWLSKPINLYFLDTSGELIHTPFDPTHDMARMAEHFGYFIFSDNLMLLIDPYSIPELAECCETQSTRIKYNDKLIIVNILDRITNFLDGFCDTINNKFAMNLAIAVTKCDEYMRLFSPDLIKLLKEVHRPGAQGPNLEPLDQISENFEEWLARFDSPAPHKVVSTFITIAKAKFDNVGFFPISSLGKHAFYEPIEVETDIGIESHEKFSVGKSLVEEEKDNSSFMPSETISTKSKTKEIRFIRKYEGALSPLYVDYPILWMHKHRR